MNDYKRVTYSPLRVTYRWDARYSHHEFHYHPEYEIYFFHKGTCKYLINNQVYDLEPGDILLMNGLTVHRPMISSEISYIRSVIHFSPNFIQGLLKSLDSEFLSFFRQKTPSSIM